MSDDFVPLTERLFEELDEAQRAAFDRTPLTQPTAAERRNGWTAEALTQYLADREAGAAVNIDPNSLHRRMAARPTSQNHRYRPHRWRG